MKNNEPSPRWGPGRLAAACALVCAAVLAVPTPAAATNDTIRQYRFEAEGTAYRLALHETPRPTAGPGQVLVRVHAVSLNRRDLNQLDRDYDPERSIAGGIPLSDGAGEVIALGEGVTRFDLGDRVAGIFFPRWIEGPPDAGALERGRGGNAEGMLSEVVVSDEQALVHVPGHLSFEEAATLPCAALTAWVGLFKRGQLQPGQHVLLEGTGGVSVFGLLFATAAGARPIITSSSNEKLQRARAHGAAGTVNYRATPQWHASVRELTGGRGVDQVLDIGGKATLPEALKSLAYGGHIALIGGLGGYGSELQTDDIMWINATVSGVYVGSREDFEAMNAFIGEHGIRPVIDRMFEFEEAPAAFQLMRDGTFFGKIVIRL